MNILVFNVGSTTLKFACIDVSTGTRLTHGTVDRIGQIGGDAVDHLSAARIAIDRHANHDIAAIGHRIVQGGGLFSAPTLVDAVVLDKLRELDELAPLHNPSARSVVQAIANSDVSTPQVLVFDSAFFSTLPPAAYRYAIPDDIYRKFGVRRYGAHGTSHRYVTNKTLEYLGGDITSKRIISLHLGGGASVTASIGGRAIETSMGMTPLEGLVMASRSGDIDASVPLHLIRHAGMSADEVDTMLNKQSGLVGLCGEPDMRKVLQRRADGDPAAMLAIDVYVHRVLKYIGAYVAILGGLDALIFTAGVGENSADLRQLIATRISHFGISLDPSVNVLPRASGELVDLTDSNATVTTLIVPTDEERAIAELTGSMIG